jgi:hypothetical protein
MSILLILLSTAVSVIGFALFVLLSFILPPLVVGAVTYGVLSATCQATYKANAWLPLILACVAWWLAWFIAMFETSNFVQLTMYPAPVLGTMLGYYLGRQAGEGLK